MPKFTLVVEEINSGDQQQQTRVFYNAEGGQKNCLEYEVYISESTDTANKQINKFKVPVKVSLAYETKSLVHDQNILEIKIIIKLEY